MGMKHSDFDFSDEDACKNLASIISSCKQYGITKLELGSLHLEFQNTANYKLDFPASPIGMPIADLKSALEAGIEAPLEARVPETKLKGEPREPTDQDHLFAAVSYDPSQDIKEHGPLP